MFQCSRVKFTSESFIILHKWEVSSSFHDRITSHTYLTTTWLLVHSHYTYMYLCITTSRQMLLEVVQWLMLNWYVTHFTINFADVLTAFSFVLNVPCVLLSVFLSPHCFPIHTVLPVNYHSYIVPSAFMLFSNSFIPIPFLYHQWWHIC